MNLNLTLVTQTIAMIVFVWFCMKFIWPPIIQALEARRKNIADGIAAAQKAGEELEQAKTDAEQLVSQARQQAGEIVDQANRRAGQIAESARDEAQTERNRQVTAAKADIEQEVNRARQELAGKVASLAVAGAEQLLEREIDAAAHRDLLDKLAAGI